MISAAELRIVEEFFSSRNLFKTPWDQEITNKNHQKFNGLTCFTNSPIDGAAYCHDDATAKDDQPTCKKEVCDGNEYHATCELAEIEGK